MKAGKYLLMDTLIVAIKALQSLCCLFRICDVKCEASLSLKDKQSLILLYDISSVNT